jgi:hypothetical protein
MSCTEQCRKPNGKQAHCGVCHMTFSVVSHFDRHRRGGVCSTPESLGLTSARGGVWAMYGVNGGRNWWNNDKDPAP